MNFKSKWSAKEMKIIKKRENELKFIFAELKKVFMVFHYFPDVTAAHSIPCV
jgi:hypothetical protein